MQRVLGQPPGREEDVEVGGAHEWNGGFVTTAGSTRPRTETPSRVPGAVYAGSLGTNPSATPWPRIGDWLPLVTTPISAPALVRY